MQAVRAGQPERSHSPLLHQGIHAAHVQLHHQAAEANEDENSAVQAALTADDMQEEAFRAAAHAGKAPKRHNARWQQKRAIRQEYAAAKSSRRPANHIASAPKTAENAVPKAENIKKRLRQTFARHPTAWAVLALAALLLAVMSSLQSCTPLAQSVGAGIHRDWHLSGGGSGRKSGGKRVCRHGKAAQRGNEQLRPPSSGI